MFHHFPMSCRQLTSQMSSWVQFSVTTMTFEVSIPWLQAHLEPLLEWVLQFLRTRSTVLFSSLAFWWSLIFLDPSCHLWFAPLWISTPLCTRESMACRQIIKYGRAKHAWMGLYLSMDQWTERLSRSLEKQGMGKINGVLVPWHKSAVSQTCAIPCTH